MLTTPEVVRELPHPAWLDEYLPDWRKVPLYHDALLAGGFAALPVMGKNELRRDFPQNFLPPGQSLDALVESHVIEVEHSSGTSEDRTAVFFRQGWWDEQEERVLRLNALVAGLLDEFPGARRVTIVPPVCNGLVCFSNFNSLSARTVRNTRFANQARIPFLNSDAEMARMAEETANWAPQFLDLDPVHGTWFARYCERQGIRFPTLKFILCSYEFVSVVHRRILERVFGVPVLNLYGSTETGHLLMENEHGKMKACHDAVYYEVVDADEQGIGELVVTTLTNDVMPLLRYRLGDLVQITKLPFGTKYVVHGRSRDALGRDDGSRVTTLEVDQCFAGVAGIAHYQLRQNGPAFALQYVADGAGPAPDDLAGLKARLDELLRSAIALTIEAVTMLPPTPSGKFRLTCRA